MTDAELAWVDDFFDFFFVCFLEVAFDFFVVLGGDPPVSGAIVGDVPV